MQINTRGISVKGKKYMDKTRLFNKIINNKNFLSSPNIVNAIRSIEGEDLVI